MKRDVKNNVKRDVKNNVKRDVKNNVQGNNVKKGVNASVQTA